jgi:type IV pilus assembly protein PilW
MRSQLKYQSGLTLIEIMISMVIGLLLLGGTISMFIANKRVYTEQEAMARLQEDARFAMGIMLHDIRMIGYTGCADDFNAVENHVNGAAGPNILSFDKVVEGSENGGTWLPSGSTDAVGNIVPGTDGITVRYLQETGLKVVPPYMVTPSGDVHLPLNNNLVQGQIVGVYDCQNVDIFQISNSAPDTSGSLAHNTGVGTPGNATKPFQKIYAGDAGIVQFVARRYYIGIGAYGGPSLFRQVFAQDKQDIDGDGDTTEVIQQNQELIEGVENMQLLYGEDTVGGDKIADTYVTADNVTNWGNVVSVRISLLFRTIKPNKQINPDTATHIMLGGIGTGGATVGPMNDYYRRRVVTATVQIRNKSI